MKSPSNSRELPRELPRKLSDPAERETRRQSTARQTNMATRDNPYVILTRQHFEPAFPDIDPTQHVCQIHHDQ